MLPVFSTTSPVFLTTLPVFPTTLPVFWRCLPVSKSTLPVFRTSLPLTKSSLPVFPTGQPEGRDGVHAPLLLQNIYFSATCISRMLVRVLLILPKVCDVMLMSGLPQFGWFGRLNASNRNWSA